MDPNTATPPNDQPQQPIQPNQPQPDLSPVSLQNPTSPASMPTPMPATAPIAVPNIVVGGDLSTPNEPTVSPLSSLNDPLPPLPPKRRKKPLLIGLAVAVLLGGSAAAYYVGYYTNPSVILSQSLSNTGKGASKLVDYFDQQSRLPYKGAEGSGTYSLKFGATATDGTFSFKGSGENSDTTVDVGLGATRVKADLRTIKASAGNSPDVYIKASGIKGLGALSGSPQIDAAVNQYDDKWVVIDHTLFDNLSAAASQSQSTAIAQNMPTGAQVVDALKAASQVNQQYLFTTDKNKAVAVVVQKFGQESVDGHKTYHYKMTLDKDHTKAYLVAQHDAVKASKLGQWLSKNNYQSALDSSFTSAEDSTKDISSKDTFELWSDVNTRLVYKVRPNVSGSSAGNYVDIGLDYKGGSSYPFFIKGQSEDSSGTSTGSLVATLDSQTSSIGLKLAFHNGGDSKFNADLTFKPSNNVVKIDTPTGAVPLMQVLGQLGLSSQLNSYLGASAANPTPPKLY